MYIYIIRLRSLSIDNVNENSTHVNKSSRLLQCWPILVHIYSHIENHKLSLKGKFMSWAVIYSNWLTYHIVTNGLLPTCVYIHISRGRDPYGTGGVRRRCYIHISGGRDPYCTGGVRRRCYEYKWLRMNGYVWYICVCDTRSMLDRIC